MLLLKKSILQWLWFRTIFVWFCRVIYTKT